jgi:hypothetical protein
MRRRAKRLSRRTITRPDCDLVLRAVDDGSGSKFVYDERVWRCICTRVHLGDAARCLVQRTFARDSWTERFKDINPAGKAAALLGP